MEPRRIGGGEPSDPLRGVGGGMDPRRIEVWEPSRMAPLGTGSGGGGGSVLRRTETGPSFSPPGCMRFGRENTTEVSLRCAVTA